MFRTFHINAGSMYGDAPFGFWSLFERMRVMTSPLPGGGGTGNFNTEPKTVNDPGGKIQFSLLQVPERAKVVCELGMNIALKVTVSIGGPGIGIAAKVYNLTAAPVPGKPGLFIEFETHDIEYPRDVALIFESDMVDANPWPFYDCEISVA